MKTFIPAVILFCLVSSDIYAIVDYSDYDQLPAPKTGKSKTRIVRRKSSSSSSSTPWQLTMGTSYESLDIKASKPKWENKVSVLKFDAELRTQTFFMQGSYWKADSMNRELVEDGSYQEGNPALQMGITWLSLEDMSADIFGGVSLASSSDIAHSRNDKSIGISTNKNFDNWVLQLKAQYIMTGAPDNPEDLAIGNITHWSGALGWAATNDIRFTLHVNQYKINPCEDSTISCMSEEYKFTSLSPRLNLVLSPSVVLEMGATFRTRVVGPESETNLWKAKLLEYPGSYGNSLFGMLKFVI